MIFDEKSIILSFAVLSDIHISDKDGDISQIKFKNALRLLNEVSKKHEHSIDLFLAVGDLIDNFRCNFDAQLQGFKRIYNEFTNAPLFYCLGDYHDLIWGDNSEAEFIKCFYNCFAEHNFKYDIDNKSVFKGNRHAIINGYHFIALEPCDRSPVLYSSEAKEWLSNILDGIEDNKYTFIITHPMIKDTCYGSLHKGEGWATEDLTPILSKHNNVVIFGGHLHYPIVDERSIMQKEFTSIGCGAVKYMAIETGGYENMSGPSTMIDSIEVSSGHLCEVDKNGNVRFTRLDFANNSEIKEPWIIPAPKKDLSHLAYYGPNRMDKATCPYFSNDFSYYINYDKENKLSISFSTGNDEDFVHHYTVDLLVNGQFVKQYKILTDFYRHPNPSEMSKTIALDTKQEFNQGETLEFKIIAYNSWQRASEEKIITFTL